jgi:uncharacterized protein YjgD (DUF1641 family)
MTNQEMIQEMLDRLQRQHEVMASTFNVIEALDRDGDFDLNDQIHTADTLLEGLGGLLDRMQKING